MPAVQEVAMCPNKSRDIERLCISGPTRTFSRHLISHEEISDVRFDSKVGALQKIICSDPRAPYPLREDMPALMISSTSRRLDAMMVEEWIICRFTL